MVKRHKSFLELTESKYPGYSIRRGLLKTQPPTHYEETDTCLSGAGHPLSDLTRKGKPDNIC